jgi:hypothetical protein
MHVAIITNNALKITSKKVKRDAKPFLKWPIVKNKNKNNGLMKIIKVMTR